jgi:hypothetical protein
MLRKIHGTNFFHIKFVVRPNIKCQNGPVLPPAQVFYFIGQTLTISKVNNLFLNFKYGTEFQNDVDYFLFYLASTLIP